MNIVEYNSEIVNFIEYLNQLPQGTIKVDEFKDILNDVYAYNNTHIRYNIDINDVIDVYQHNINNPDKAIDIKKVIDKYSLSVNWNPEYELRELAKECKKTKSLDGILEGFLNKFKKETENKKILPIQDISK